MLLLPTLLATADETGVKSRVVSVSSIVHHRRARIDYDTLRGDDPTRLRLSAYERYAQSKYGVVVFANELARRHGDKLVSVSLNPGNIRTVSFPFSATWWLNTRVCRAFGDTRTRRHFTID